MSSLWLARIPRFNAAAWPCRLVRKQTTRGKLSATEAVWSVEPSSMTMSSSGGRDCVRTLTSARPRVRSPL